MEPPKQKNSGGLRFFQLCLALVGFLLAGLLWMEERGAIRLPCGEVAMAAEDCREVRKALGGLPAGTNAALGVLGFGFLVILLHLEPRFQTSRGRQTGLLLRRLALGGGTIYGLALVGLQVAHGRYCLWCLAVWALWAILVLLEFVSRRPVSAPKDTWQHLDATAMLAVGLSALVGWGLLVQPAPPVNLAVATELRRWIDPQYLEALGPCGYAENKTQTGYRNWNAWRIIGDANAPVVVTLFWDPLCATCHALEKKLLHLAREVPGTFRIDSIPVAMLPESIPLVQTLYAAEIFQPGNSLNAAIADQKQNFIGNPAQLRQAISDAGLPQNFDTNSRPAMVAVQAADKLFRSLVTDVAVPSLWINGRMVNSSNASRSTTCLTRLIARAWSESTGQPLEAEQDSGQESSTGLPLLPQQ